jgi:hypothetical protein
VPVLISVRAAFTRNCGRPGSPTALPSNATSAWRVKAILSDSIVVTLMRRREFTWPEAPAHWRVTVLLVPTRIYSQHSAPEGCHVMLDTDHGDIPRGPNPPAAIPDVLSGPGGLIIVTRCPDFGQIDLQVWSGDPGPSNGWDPIHEGRWETISSGFRVGFGMGPTFRIDAPKGDYRIRADVQRDSHKRVSAVRFVFPDAPHLTGTVINP